MRADLHVHSSASDGTEPPAEVMRRAAQAGLDVVALTDHDTVAGHAEARRALADSPLRSLTLLPGMELSCRLGERSRGVPGELLVSSPRGPHSVHLLAYLFDAGTGSWPPNSAVSGTTACCAREPWWTPARGPRRRHQLGPGGRHRRPGRGRPPAHSPRDGGQRRRRLPREAFTRDWIADGGRAYVGRYALDPVHAIGLVRDAGGVAVLAHPRAGSDWVVSDEEIGRLAAAGLAGVEVFHPDQPAAERAGLLALAHDLGLVATGGSDDHGSLTGHRIGCETVAADAYQALISQASNSLS